MFHVIQNSRMQKLIDSVRSIPCLWNPTHRDYRDMVKKDRAWQTVVNILNTHYIPDITTAKSEWKKLRDNHRDSLKRSKEKITNGQEDHVNTWRYAEDMAFLLPYMKSRKSSFIIPRILESDTEENSEGNAMCEINIEPEDNDQDSNQSRSFEGDRKRKRENDDVLSFELLRENYMDLSHEDKVMKRVDGRRHPLDPFFESMCETTKQFPVWLQRQVKRQIFTVISEAEDCLDSSLGYERGVLPSTLVRTAQNSQNVNAETDSNSVKLEKDPL